MGGRLIYQVKKRKRYKLKPSAASNSWHTSFPIEERMSLPSADASVKFSRNVYSYKLLLRFSATGHRNWASKRQLFVFSLVAPASTDVGTCTAVLSNPSHKSKIQWRCKSDTSSPCLDLSRFLSFKGNIWIKSSTMVGPSKIWWQIILS